MTWNFNIDEAPRGQIVEHEVVRNGKTVKTKAFAPDRIMAASKCEAVFPTYWVEKENRWSGFCKDEQPLAWQPYPVHPNFKEQVA